MTMLEKAAAAVWEESRSAGDPLFSELMPSDVEMLSNIVRAALEAIREPDEAATNLAADQMFDCFDGYNEETRRHMQMMQRGNNAANVRRAWPAMIDAILSGEA